MNTLTSYSRWLGGIGTYLQTQDYPAFQKMLYHGTDARNQDVGAEAGRKLVTIR